MPDSATAYRLQTAALSADGARQLADRLGLAGPVESVLSSDGSVAGFFVTDTPGCLPAAEPPPASSPPACDRQKRLQMMLDGSFTFYDGKVAPATDEPSPQLAESSARDWLARSALTNGDPFALRSGRVYATMRKQLPVPVGEDRRLREVIVELPAPRDQVLDHPRITMTVASDGSVLEAGGDRATVTDEFVQPLRTAAELLRDLQRERGSFAGLAVLGPQPHPIEYSTDATAVVESVELAHTRAVDGDTAYLVPVFVIECRLSQASLTEQPLFTTWVPAAR